jgi:hypothetical protein
MFGLGVDGVGVVRSVGSRCAGLLEEGKMMDDGRIVCSIDIIEPAGLVHLHCSQIRGEAK